MRPRSYSAFAVIAIAATSLSAQEPADETSPSTLDYAERYNVTIEDAEARFARLAEISRIEKELTEKFPNQFGGLYVEHEPEFRVVVKMTGAGQGLLRQITDDPLYVVEKAEVPVKQLRQLQERVAETLVSDGSYYYAVEANIFEGMVFIRTTNPQALQAALPRNIAVNDKVKVIEVEGGMANTATIYGGRLMTGTSQNCTSGFNVLANGTPMLLTAGHCDDRMTVSGRTFNVVERVFKSSSTWGFDMQIMRPSSAQTHPNEVYSDRSTRETITNVYFAADLPLNWPVCAFGAVTNTRKCGKLVSKWERVRDDRNVSGSFHRAEPDDGRAFVQGGDSGGPVMGAGTAYGIIKGRGDTYHPNHMYFMDIITLQASGGFVYHDVSVKTSP